VVITSATIDAERFSKHFNDAPVIEVSGRTYPVEIRWRPIEREEPATPAKAEREKKDKDAPDQIAAILDATDELARWAPATSWCSCRASARSATPPRR
jgi:ATP-dependent helicase HrpA